MSKFSVTVTSCDDGDSAVAPSRLHPSEVADRIAVMRAQEENVYRCRDCFSVGSQQAVEEAMPQRTPRQSSPQQQQQKPPQSKPVDAECRVKMVEWCAQVIDFCKFSRETVGIGMSYLDRFVATGVRRARLALADRKEYQLSAMTCLYMAIKLNEPLEMETKLLSDLSRGCYTETEISAMEREILQALEWRVAGPTPLGFVQHFLAVGLDGTMASSDPAIEATLLDFSRFQTELAIGISSLVSVVPSKIALAAILNSMEAINVDALDPFERSAFVASIVRTSNLDPTSEEVRQARTLLMDSFVKNSGYHLRQVASQLSFGRSGTSLGKYKASSEGSSPEISPVCVATNINSKKQRCG